MNDYIKIFESKNYSKLLLINKFDFRQILDNYVFDFLELKSNIAKHVIDHSINLNDSNKYQATILHIVCFHGKIDTIKYLIYKKINVNVATVDKNQPIHLATDNIKIIKMLIRAGANPEAVDQFLRMPIHLACINNNLPVVKYLIKQNVIINVPDALEKRPIHYACYYGSLEIVQILVDGFSSDRIVKCRPQIDLECFDNENKKPIDCTQNDYIKKYLEEKMKYLTSTIFPNILNVYFDIQFILKN